MRRKQTDWWMVALGVVCAVVLCLAAVFVPKRQTVSGGVMDEVSGDIYRAVTHGDRQALGLARERLRRVVHDDLLGRSVPGMLKIVDTLAQTPQSCDPRSGRSFERGICLIRQRRFDQALLAFAAVPKQRGGVLFRDVAVRLMAHHRRASRSPGEAPR